MNKNYRPKGRPYSYGQGVKTKVLRIPAKYENEIREFAMQLCKKELERKSQA